MIKIKLVVVGNLKEQYLKDACAEYCKRLQKFCTLEIVELKEKETLKQEAEMIIPQLLGYIIVLDVNGKKMTSENFSNLLCDVSQTNSIVTFVIGSSCGLLEEVKQKANLKLSFSDMTFPHQLFRVLLLEQTYRAFCIANNIKYHK